MKTEKAAMIAVAAFIFASVVLIWVMGVSSTEEFYRKKAENKDVDGYRKKVDAIFERWRKTYLSTPNRQNHQTSR